MTNNLEKRIISDVFKLEKKKTKTFFAKYFLSIAVFSTGAVFIMWLVYQILLDQGTLDLLQLVNEDREIIETYWQDTLSVFITEMPHKLSILLALLLVVLVIILAIFVLRLPRVWRKMRNLKQFAP